MIKTPLYTLNQLGGAISRTSVTKTLSPFEIQTKKITNGLYLPGLPRRNHDGRERVSAVNLPIGDLTSARLSLRET